MRSQRKVAEVLFYMTQTCPFVVNVTSGEHLQRRRYFTQSHGSNVREDENIFLRALECDYLNIHSTDRQLLLANFAQQPETKSYSPAGCRLHAPQLLIRPTSYNLC